MEINRNQYFLVGMVLLLLGLQLRIVDSYELNQEATQFLAQRAGKTEVGSSFISTTQKVTGARKKVSPPPWIGWFLLSAGSVLILHSLAMKRPE